jgi:hypothetical protein
VRQRAYAGNCALFDVNAATGVGSQLSTDVSALLLGLL